MRVNLVLVVLAAWLLGACATQADDKRNSGAESTSSLVAAIDSRVAPFVAARDFMGVIGIKRPGEAPVYRAYGFASLELGVAHTPASRFMIGSVSKQFTAAAILLLEEDGRLSVDSPVSEYLPDFPHGNLVTVSQLVDHTAAVWDIYSLKSYARGRGLAPDFDAVIAELYEQPLTGEPGRQFQYSNGGYALLAAIIERVSGQSYPAFLESRIFARLGMDDTFDGTPGPARRGNVEGYDPWGQSALTAAEPAPYAYLKGSGSLWSTAQDLLTWSAALHGGRVLGPAAYSKFINNRQNGYGYGVSIFDRFGRKTVGHDGRVSGYASDLAHYLEEETAIVVLGNVQSAARDTIRNQVAAAVFEIEDARAEVRSFGETPEDPGEHEGDYSFGPGFVVYVRVRDGRLMAAANEGGWSELVPLANGMWFSRMLYATVRFERADGDSISRLVWGAGQGAPAGLKTL